MRGRAERSGEEDLKEKMAFCLKCGTKNSSDMEYCLRCGQKLRHKAKVKNKNEKKEKRLRYSTLQYDNKAVSEGEIEINRIYCGDCLEVMKKMPSEFVDLIVTSPPYNFGLDDYDVHDDTKSWDEYFEFLYKVWCECHRVLKHGGRICIVIQPLFSDYMPTHHIISQQLREIGFLFKTEIIWEKHNYNCKYTAWGSWCSPSMPYFKYTWEFIEVFCKGSQKKEGKKENIDITAEEFKRWVYSKWEIPPETRMKEFGHPSMFPEEIPYRLIKLFSYVGDIVLDPFNGAGTTTLVARKLNRRYIGIDISPKYCETARKRIEEYEKQAKLSDYK